MVDEKYLRYGAIIKTGDGRVCNIDEVCADGIVCADEVGMDDALCVFVGYRELSPKDLEEAELVAVGACGACRIDCDLPE